MATRIGQGVDLHPFTEGRPLILGGVTIPHDQGLKGHSDADALSHAICDALLGALALGDLGQHFSEKDEKNRNRSSLEFLTKVMGMVAQHGWKVENIDSTIMTEQPMLRPYIEPMRQNIAKALHIEVEQVSVKATRAEKLGALGRDEGLMATASVLLSK